MMSEKVPDPFTSRAAVFVETGRPLEIREFEIPRAVEADAALCKVTMSAICGSDLHTIDGRRRASGPIILGHEICGTIVRLGRDVSCDFTGRPLAPGDRVTWSIAASCGQCFYCREGIPQKCESLFKYGHQDINTKPALSGGFAQYVYLAGGTAIFRLPDDLSDRGAVFANCSLATMVAAVRLADLREGETVLVQGAGLVGLCAAALAAARGARAVMVADPHPERLAMAEDFGAAHTCNISTASREAFLHQAAEVAGPRGFDVAIHACGRPAAVALGIEALRIGGRYVLAGCVCPGATAEIDLCAVTTRMVRLIGLHNYRGDDLQAALEFLVDENGGRKHPFDRVVGEVLPLERINDAIDLARTRKDILRVAVAPDA